MRVINVRCNWKHCLLENSIRKIDSSPDMSRSAIFVRALEAAKDVKNWITIKDGLVDLKEDPKVPIYSSFQAHGDRKIAESLEEVRHNILDQLKGAIKVLQSQYLLQLLLLNYLQVLERERIALRTGNQIDEGTLTLPDMAKIFTEIMLLDQECDELNQIRRILATWRTEHPEQK